MGAYYMPAYYYLISRKDKKVRFVYKGKLLEVEIQKFKEIINAWVIAKNPSDEQKILAEKRYNVCDECPSKKTITTKLTKLKIWMINHNINLRRFVLRKICT